MRTLVALDFDWTIIDEDSDRAVYSLLSSDILATYKSNHFTTMQWTDLMNKIYNELHQLGITRDQLERVFARLALHPSMKAALEHAHQSGQTDLVIISDANTTAIWECLRANGLDTIFSQVITNQSQWTSEGQLRVERYVPAHEEHGCLRRIIRHRAAIMDDDNDVTITTGTTTRSNVTVEMRPCCTVNICKGKEIRRLRAEYDRVVYLGDGQNDFCPGCELTSQDVFMPRRHRALHRILSGPDVSQVKANIVYWSEASDVLDIFQSRLFRSVSPMTSATRLMMNNEETTQEKVKVVVH
ncbi:phosphatase phospho-type [Syncephalis plumigaleata]|nr:phosphatase phospho-type [Syncephalis plumigaleata]